MLHNLQFIALGVELGAEIKVAVLKHQVDSVLVRKSVRQYHLEVNKPDFERKVRSAEEPGAANVIDLNRFKGKGNQSLAVNRNEILLQAKISNEGSGPIRGFYIDKYRQVQGSLAYLKNEPSVEIKI
ncbi:MAG: hypothetical protein A3K22_04635 [Deltaproteobacteria bacterium RBG_16_42_7]|nr:MAG: hypothetical protein A3K22_04635 [Deltaproteobacteria bacterium RBG_16_42_7]